MKTKENLTRRSDDRSAFEGWRLRLCKAGTTMTHYFPDADFHGSASKSLAAVENAMVDFKARIDGSKRVAGKLKACATVEVRKSFFVSLIRCSALPASARNLGDKAC